MPCIDFKVDTMRDVVDVGDVALTEVNWDATHGVAERQGMTHTASATQRNAGASSVKRT